MYRTEGVLVLLVLYVGLAHSFSWDIVVAGYKQLEFYDSNGTRTHIEDIPRHYIRSMAYDPVHNRVLFVDEISENVFISSFNIATRKIAFLVEIVQSALVSIAYDPATQLLFWTETGSKSKKSISSKPGYANAVEQNLLIKLDGDEFIYCITVDSCGGYIYWSTNSKIERARFDGSERQVVIVKDCHERGGIAIDQQTQKIYWIDNQYYYNGYQMSIESADLNGENRRTLYIESDIKTAHGLVVSKDFIYWRRYETFLQLTKNPPHDKEVEPKKFLLAGSSEPVGMTSNHKIENCEVLLPINSETHDCASLNVSTNVSLLCVHGTEVNREPRCECTQGYIGERCEVSVCHNYCFQGDCTVSAEGRPKCRCNAGYSGDRCEVNACSTPTIVPGAASYLSAIDSLNIISQELNNTLEGWRVDMDALAEFTNDIKGTLRGWRDEMEISIMSKLNDSIIFTLSDMKQEMNTLLCSEHEKLKESFRTVAHDVSKLKSSAQFQVAEQKELKEHVDTTARHSSDQSQTLVHTLE